MEKAAEKTGRDYQVISADSHVVEPPDLWDVWLEAKFRPQAPKLMQDPDGGDAWLYDPKGKPEPLGLVTVMGRKFEDFSWNGVRYGHEIRPACYEGEARIAALDEDGVDAEFLYAPMRAIATFMGYEDADLQLAGIRAYNRWVQEGFCAADPQRLFPIAAIPNVGIEASVSELYALRRAGFRGVMLKAWPSGGEALSEADDPFWAAAEATGTPVSLHVWLASQLDKQRPFAQGVKPAVGATNYKYTMELMTEMIFTGLFDRYPDLKIVAAECGAGWIPYFMYELDDRYWRNRTWSGLTLKKLPSRYFKDNWTVTFIQDRMAIESRHAVGIENMCWSTDFPHHPNDWPYSRKVITDHFVNVPEAEKQRIVCGNAAKLYGL